MGTPEFALPSLEALVTHPNVETQLVVTRPDAPRGRGLVMAESPVKIRAKNHGIEIFQPEAINAPSSLAVLEAKVPDVIIVAAFGAFLGARLFSLPSGGCLNVHPSLLPKYRGASPINTAIINGDTETGVTIFKIIKEMDAGDILLQKKFAIDPGENAGELHDRLAVIGGSLVSETIDLVASGQTEYYKQDESKVVFAPKLSKEDRHIKWDRDSHEVFNHIRGVSPRPGAFAFLDGRRFKIIQACCNEGSLSHEPGEVFVNKNEELEVCCSQGKIIIQKLQPEGGKALSSPDFCHGHKVHCGSRFT